MGQAAGQRSMVAAAYVPDRGHIVWITLSDGSGHEQAGRRPALVISPRIYNARSGMVLLCPITSQAKEYPFEVAVGAGRVRGVALVDQLRSIDWQVRRAQYAGRLSAGVFQEVQEKVKKLIE